MTVYGTYNHNAAATAVAVAAVEAKAAPVGADDPSWQEIWRIHHDGGGGVSSNGSINGHRRSHNLLLDPADVHASLNDLMARVTNKLSSTEMLFLQRKIRSAVRISQKVHQSDKAASRKGRLSAAFQSAAGGSNGDGGNGAVDTKTVAEKYHLLTQYVVRQVLPRMPDVASNGGGASTTAAPMAPSLGSNGGSNRSLSSLGGGSHHGNGGNGGGGRHPSMEYSIQPVETAYLLALYCNDSLWDRVADIAAQSAKKAGLEMDVNKQILIKNEKMTVTGTNGDDKVNGSSIPEPSPPKAETPCDVPLGVGMHALTFILTLALRKFRRDDWNLFTSLCTTFVVVERRSS